jgi:hypothetical protein
MHTENCDKIESLNKFAVNELADGENVMCDTRKDFSPAQRLMATD